jgi:hypothetical protein
MYDYTDMVYNLLTKCVDPIVHVKNRKAQHAFRTVIAVYLHRLLLQFLILNCSRKGVAYFGII